MTGQWTAPPAHYVLHAEPRTLLVEADRVERPAVPANHVPVLLVRRIENRLQEVHETVRAPSLTKRLVSHARPNDVTQGYAADWTIAQLPEPAQKIADRIKAIMRSAASSVDAGA